MSPPVRAAPASAGAALLVALTVGTVVPPAPALAADGKPCVGVIVDARLLGGEVRTGCAQGDPETGLDALHAAGFRYSFAPRVPGFVCELDGAPECSRTTTTTYWSYWHRAKGSTTWVYSSAGAGGRDPAPGTTEAWVWQDGGRVQPPDIALRTICPQVAQHRDPTRDASAQTPRSGGSTTAPEAARSSSRGDGPAAKEGTSSSARTPGAASAKRPGRAGRNASGAGSATSARSATASSRPATPTTDSPDTAGTPAAGVGSAGSAARADGPQQQSRPWAGLVIGGGLVAALGAAAMARFRGSRGGR